MVGGVSAFLSECCLCSEASIGRENKWPILSLALRLYCPLDYLQDRFDFQPFIASFVFSGEPFRDPGDHRPAEIAAKPYHHLLSLG